MGTLQDAPSDQGAIAHPSSHGFQERFGVPSYPHDYENLYGGDRANGMK